MDSITQFIHDNLMTHSFWLLLTYSVVVVAMAVDLATGVHKAKVLGIKRNSRGYKRTCDKAMKYFLPMICLTCIDMLASAIFSLPVLSMVFGAYCVFCEWKSVMESVYEKKEIIENLHRAERLIDKRKDLYEIITELIKIYENEKNR